LSCTLTINIKSILKRQLKSKIRIKDIANQAKVSIGTVDRVLHDRGEVAEATRDHIMKIIKDLGYTPNLLAKSLSSKRKYKISVLIPDYNNNPYWEKPLMGINLAASELRNYNVEVIIHFFDLNDERSFTDKSEEIFELKPDGLIFAPVHYNVTKQIIDKCENIGIPYVFFDMLVEDCNNLSFFGQDAYMSGFLAGRLMSYCLASPNEVLILKLISNTGTNHHLKKREDGFNAFISSSENKKSIRIHSQEIDITTDEKLYKGLDEVISKYTGLGGIFAVNSRVHKVARYIEEKKIQGLVLMGYDLLTENIHYLDKGVIQFLIGQKADEQGYKSVMALFNYLLLNKPVDKTNYSPIDIIMKDNIDYYRNTKT
jgi:LacI family transcriptional regulator